MKTLILTEDEIGDLQFTLARMAEYNDQRADELGKDFGEGPLSQALRDQAERFRALARKVTGDCFCSHCGEPASVDSDGNVQTHDFPRPCRSVCPGSDKPPRKS